MILYDNLGYNNAIALDLPYREGIGALTHDVAKPHHPIQMMNTPTWTPLASGLMTMEFDGVNQYLRATNADTADMGFIAGDYSLGGWFNWNLGDDSQILTGRYAVDIGGWELYLYTTGALTLRHHHAGGATVRSGMYSYGWTTNTWHMYGVSRVGSVATFYRNGQPIQSIGALLDPEASASWFVMGVRFTLATNLFKGQRWRDRVWPRALSAREWLTIYERERGWFP